jgi:hypothetical protein
VRKTKQIGFETNHLNLVIQKPQKRVSTLLANLRKEFVILNQKEVGDQKSEGFLPIKANNFNSSIKSQIRSLELVQGLNRYWMDCIFLLFAFYVLPIPSSFSLPLSSNTLI